MRRAPRISPVALALAASLLAACSPDAGGSPTSIEGIVVDSAGRPQEGSEVFASPENGSPGRPRWMSAKSDAEGRFRIADLREEPHEVEAHGKDYFRFGHFSSRIGHASEPVAGVRPGARGLRLVLLAPGCAVGTVGSAGEHAEYPRISVYLVRADKAHAGHPRGALGGAVAVPCRVEGKRLVPEPVREGVRPSAIVVWSEDGDRTGDRVKEIAGALDEIPYSYRVSDDQVSIDGGGRFREEGLRPGRWRLEVDDVRVLPSDAEFDVKAGAQSLVQLPIRRRGWLEARVLGPGDRPVPGACVAVLDAKGEPVPVLVESVVLSNTGGMHSSSSLEDLFRGITTAGREGTTERRFLDPGRYRARVLAEGFRPFEADLEVAAGRRSLLEVRLEPER